MPNEIVFVKATKYKNKCAFCQEEIPAGSQCWWRKGTKENYHDNDKCPPRFQARGTTAYTKPSANSNSASSERVGEAKKAGAGNPPEKFAEPVPADISNSEIKAIVQSNLDYADSLVRLKYNLSKEAMLSEAMLELVQELAHEQHALLYMRKEEEYKLFNMEKGKRLGFR